MQIVDIITSEIILQTGDEVSRNGAVFYVKFGEEVYKAQSMNGNDPVPGLPARLEYAGKLQFFKGDKWIKL